MLNSSPGHKENKLGYDGQRIWWSHSKAVLCQWLEIVKEYTD